LHGKTITVRNNIFIITASIMLVSNNYINNSIKELYSGTKKYIVVSLKMSFIYISLIELLIYNYYYITYYYIIIIIQGESF